MRPVAWQMRVARRIGPLRMLWSMRRISPSWTPTNSMLLYTGRLGMAKKSWWRSSSGAEHRSGSRTLRGSRRCTWRCGTGSCRPWQPCGDMTEILPWSLTARVAHHSTMQLTAVTFMSWNGCAPVGAMPGRRYLQGAGVNSRDAYELTPLHCAVMAGKQQTVQLLLRRSADALSVDTKGRLPLHWAALHGRGALPASVHSEGSLGGLVALRSKDSGGRLPRELVQRWDVATRLQLVALEAWCTWQETAGRWRHLPAP
ncbi:unnamed protein product [Durusdinium trenchii]|uniref:Uncharacterized protein n=1 Tax=Durusdinium trenchii TaxID=1381693 RepID=A0ABP0QNU2_9DINO